MSASGSDHQTPIRDLTSSTAQMMSTSSAATLLFQPIGLINRCAERLITSPPAGTMNIWHIGNEHTTPSTSQSPSDLIPRAHTVDLINLLVCANVYMLHSKSKNTFSSVTVPPRALATTFSGRQRLKLEKIQPPWYIGYKNFPGTIISPQYLKVPT